MMKIIILTLGAGALVLGAPAPQQEDHPEYEYSKNGQQEYEYSKNDLTGFELDVDEVMIDAKIKSEKKFEKRSAMEDKAKKIAGFDQDTRYLDETVAEDGHRDGKNNGFNVAEEFRSLPLRI